VRAEKKAMSSFWSRAPTAMMNGLFAGAPTKPKLPTRRSALLPAAAMINEPASRARLPTTVYGGCTCATSAPSDMEMMWHSFSTAQLIPAMMPESEPEPSSPNTFPTKMSAPWATP
jgi:hypothetical protein